MLASSYGDNDSASAALNNKKRYNKPPPIDLNRVKTNNEKEDGPNDQSGNNGGKVVGLVLLGIPVIAFGLGCWQIKRREWKVNLIELLKSRTQSKPRELPKDIDFNNLDEFMETNEFTPFKVKGHFLHSREVVLTIRHDMTHTVSGPGGLVITPFVLSDRPDTMILVNRGFVPYTHYSPTSRLETQFEQELEITGYLRKDEPTNRFTLNNKPPDVWHYRDIRSMAEALGTQPIFLDQYDLKRTIADRKVPIPNQTNIAIRNEHMSYIITWFSLSGFTSYLWWRRFANIFF